MTTTLILSLLLAALYMGAAICRLRALPDSISAMVYLLPSGPWRWLWSAWLWAVTILLAPALIETMPDAWRFLAFLCAACLLFVGTMPLFDTAHRKHHNALGIAAGILSQLCVALISPQWLLAWAAVPATLAMMYFRPERTHWIDGKGVFLAEIICATTTYAVLFSRLL